MKTLSNKNAWLIALNYGVGYLFLYPILIVYFASFLMQQTGINYYSTIVNIFYVIFFLVTFYWGRSLLSTAYREFKEGWKKIVKSAITNYLLSYGATVLISMILVFFTSKTSSVNQTVIEEQLKSTTLTIVLLSTIFAPLMEELFFRGVIYNKLTLRFNFYVGAIVSSVLFGLMHIMTTLLAGEFSEILFSFQYMVIGFFIARSYYQTKSFATPLLFHFIQNTLSVIILLVLG